MYDLGCMTTRLTPNHNPPGISNLVWHPLERLSPSKTLLHYTIMRKTIVPTIKRKKKNPFIHVNTASNNLNFTL